MDERNAPVEWPIEPVESFKDHHKLYRAVPKMLWERFDSVDQVDESFFIWPKKRDGLSTDWSKYAEPIDTLNRRPEHKRSLNHYGIASISVRKLKELISNGILPL